MAFLTVVQAPGLAEKQDGRRYNKFFIRQWKTVLLNLGGGNLQEGY